MKYFENQKLNRPCYGLFGFREGYAVTDTSSLCFVDANGETKEKFVIPHPAKGCRFGETQIGILNTKGKLYIIDVIENTLKQANVPIFGEGDAIIFYDDCLYYTSRSGTALRYVIESDEVEVLIDLSHEDVMFTNIDIDKETGVIYITVLNCSDNTNYVIAMSHSNPSDYSHLTLPQETSPISLGVGVVSGKMFCVCNKLSAIQILGISCDGKSIEIVDTIKLSCRKYGQFDGGYSVKCGCIALHNRQNVAVINTYSKQVEFHLQEKYISNVTFSNDQMLIGCWDKGYIFSCEAISES